MTREDWLECCRMVLARQRRRPGPLWLLVLLAIIALLLFLVVPDLVLIPYRLAKPETVDGFRAGTLLGLLLATGMAAMMHRAAAAQSARGMSHLLGPHVYAFSATGFALESESMTVRLCWSAVRRIETTPRLILLWSDDVTAQPVPRTAFADPADEAQVLAAIRAWAPHLAGQA